MSTRAKLTFEAALLAGIVEEMRADSRVFCMATRPQESLTAEFGSARARMMPISEAAMTGVAVGAAAAGLRPVVFWRNSGFTYLAFDQVANQAAKLRYMFGGQCDFPIVFRAECGTDHQLAAQHCQAIYSMFAHVAGLKVILPSSATDAKGLIKSAIRDSNPVCCFEPISLYSTEGEVGDSDYVVPLGVAEVKREGRDVTVVALGAAVRLALQAAEELATQGISVEVVDPRTLVPLDVDSIRRSVRKTGRLVVAEEAQPMCSMASEICAVVTEDDETYRALRSPLRRVNSKPVPIPYSPPLEEFVIISKDRIEHAIRSVLEPGRDSD